MIVTTNSRRRNVACDGEGHLAAAAVVEGVARDLGDGGRNARLLPAVEAEEAGELPRSLPGEDDVVLARQRRPS